MSPSQAAVGLDIGAVQGALRADGLDGWLLYDFRGLNPLAADVTKVNRQGGHLATRRWYYLIPSSGEPRGLVHAIEKNSLTHLPGTTERYAGRDQLEAGLRLLLTGVQRVAMEYSPGCAIPYIARVDAGTVELVRQAGVDVVAQRLRDGIATTEYAIQQLMAGWFRDEGLVSDSDPIVSAAEHSGNPHYLPTAREHRAIQADEIVLLDLW